MENLYNQKMASLGYNQLVCDIFIKWEDVKDEILIPERKSGSGNGTIHVFLGTADAKLKNEFRSYYSAVENGEDPSIRAVKVKHIFLVSNIISMLGYVCKYYHSKNEAFEKSINDNLNLLDSYNDGNGCLSTQSLFKLSTGSSKLRPYFKQFESDGVFVKLVRQILLPNSAYKISLYKNASGEYAAFWLIGFDLQTNFEANSSISHLKNTCGTEKILVKAKHLTEFILSVVKYFSSIDKLNSFIPYANAVNPGTPIKISKDEAFNLVGMFLETTHEDVKQRNKVRIPRWFEEDVFSLGNRNVYLSTQWNSTGDYQLTLTDFIKLIHTCYGSRFVYRLGANNEHQLWEMYDSQNNPLPLQQIYYGAPGTGKSHKIKDDADVKAADEKNLVFRTTFHPDSDYSTFVGCYKPTTSKSGIRGQQPILDYDSLVDKFKEYLNIPNVNITKACTLFGFDYHDSIIRIQENGRKVMDLVNDAYKSNTSYDSVVRGGMACYEQNPIQENGSKITYEFVPQAFTNAYVKAWNTDEEVYLIIEEINRGNCAQIFGDLFQLLDRKNGESEYPVEADADLQSYLQKELANTTRADIPEDVKSGKILKLPSNLYIWATMNTSDQSLFPIDSAFKRRWEWKYIKIKEGKDEYGNKLNWKIDVKLDDTGEQLSWWAFIKKINEIIASMTSSADKQLGYFFCCAKDDVIDEETFVSKVIFYLWNDVFKDYGFEDASLFRYTTKDADGKDAEKDLTFPDFYDEEGEKVNTERLTDFVKKVMNWKKTNAEQD